MGQFTVHRNTDPMTEHRVPLFVDIQNDLLTHLATRIVIPLARQQGQQYDIMWTLVPELTINGQRYVLLVPQLMHVKAEQLGPAVAEVKHERHEVLAAVEMLFKGL
jgi:toxin CcdB